MLSSLTGALYFMMSVTFWIFAQPSATGTTISEWGQVEFGQIECGQDEFGLVKWERMRKRRKCHLCHHFSLSILSIFSQIPVRYVTSENEDNELVIIKLMPSLIPPWSVTLGPISSLLWDHFDGCYCKKMLMYQFSPQVCAKKQIGSMIDIFIRKEAVAKRSL